jgi:chemotaxis protein histidine kinase CheA
MHIKIIAVGVSLQLKEPRRAEAMTIDPSNAMNADSRDQILAQLCSEFLVDAQDRLEDIAHELKTSQTPDSDAEETLLAIRRQCHSLKGMGGAFGFPTITLIAHRLEDYLARAHVINPRIVRDINFYCQRLLHII